MTRALAFALILALALPARAQETRTAIFAGGCFWCVEADFDKLDGVVETVSGYTGGELANPSYEQVASQRTDHLEAVRIRFDPARVSYETLVEVFFRTVDPLDDGGQFCDRGPSYRTAIFVQDDRQREIAERGKREAAEALGAGIVTPIREAGPFWPAEDHHQDYYEKKPLSYRFYRWNCWRDQRVEELWGASPEETLKAAG